jgi:two-component system sensor histidine kinase SenX3
MRGEVLFQHPSIWPVSPTVAALVAFVVGVAVGSLLAWAIRRGPRGVESPDFVQEQPIVPPGVSEVLAVLRSSAIVVGPHDEVLQASDPARTLGLVRGSRVAAPELLDLVRGARRDQVVRTAELEVRARPGAAVTYLSARVAPLDSNLILVLAEDRTAERRIEQTRRDFVANVSHELKTPIGAISLLAEAVEGAAEDPSAVRRFANRMGIESARLTDLVAQLTELSRLQSDNPLARAEEVDVDAMLSDAVDRCRVDADRHDVSLTIAGQQHCRVLGSARMLSTAVSNLVENAVIYSDPGARVVVAAHRQARSDDDYVEITVSDNGIGIPPGDLERIFERFYRVDYARSRANGGTGLGLSIVKHIAAVHGGQVSVWSQLGHGSTFTLSIPAHLHREPGIRPGDQPDSHDRAVVDPTSSQQQGSTR